MVTRRVLLAGMGGGFLSGCAAPSAPWPANPLVWRPQPVRATEVVEAVRDQDILDPNADVPAEVRKLSGIWVGNIGSFPGFPIGLAVQSVGQQALRIVYASRSGSPGGYRTLYVARMSLDHVGGREFSGTTSGIRLNIRGRDDDRLDFISGNASFTHWVAGVLARYQPAEASRILDRGAAEA